MEILLEGLKKKEIISSRNVNDIRKYIYKKHPELTVSERSSILANTIKFILKRNIPPIEGLDNESIRSNILSAAVKKQSFSVSAYEIFQSCLPHIKDEGEKVDCFIEWVNSIQNSSVSEEQLRRLLHQKSGDVINYKQDKNLAIELQQDRDYQVDRNAYCARSIQANCLNIIYNIINKRRKAFLILTALCAVISVLGIHNISRTEAPNASPQLTYTIHIENAAQNKGNERPPALQYISINKDKMRKWLSKKNSMLSEEPYFSAIIEKCKQYDINPLFMIAITGQEQAYVPKTNINSKVIANNPFNVFGSWQIYNTDIYDSADIAAKTIINLSKDMPYGTDCIEWINKRYAEDENWHIGVNLIFNQLVREVGYEEQNK